MAERLRTLLLSSDQPVTSRELDALMADAAPRLARRIIASRAELAALDRETLAGARMISFLSGVIVPATVLRQLGYGAYNIHPGSPAYPGWAPPCFAAYERAPQFGATAHVMIAAIDAGPIIDSELVPMPPTASVMDYYRQGTAAAARLLWRLAPRFAKAAMVPPSGEAWSGRRRTRAELRRLCRLEIGLDGDELARRIAAFGAGLGGERPEIMVQGHAFSPRIEKS